MHSASQPISHASDTPHFDFAALLFCPEGLCRFATARACDAVAQAAPIGLDHHALFARWTVRPNLEAQGGVSVAHDAEGRQFRCEAMRDPDGTTRLIMIDLSTPLREDVHTARDPLTGLHQRSGLHLRLSQMVGEATSTGDTLAVHYIDLDRFKSVNDTLGHGVGDTLLVKVAERLRTTLKPGDCAARIGGDEFVVIQAGASAGEAGQRSSRLVDLVGRTYVTNGHTLNVGASVGVALFPKDGTDAETLLRHADLALYRAKAEGRNTARFFEPAMNARMQARLALEVDLRKALAFRQFHLNYQPLVNVSAGEVTGFEALLRWTHPERGPVSPADFIPLAEEIGLIAQIGEWVLRTACREATLWPTPATIAVNISPHQFKGGRLVQTVMSVLAATQLSPARLELEITEGALLDETNLVLTTLHALRALGVRISMDDFGTGYSSLSYLRKFPFDKIKIDQSFVRGLGVSDDCDAIVRAVSGLGASLGMRTTAEGVETAEQLERIRREGCTEVQGYLTGRPLSAADATTLLNAQLGETR